MSEATRSLASVARRGAAIEGEPQRLIVPEDNLLGANHPSFIWYAAQQPNARPLALKITKQDLIAACWQAAMTLGAEPDSAATLAWCTSKWNARPRDVCVLTETQAFDMPAGQAQRACLAGAMKALLTAPEIADEQAARLERAAALRAIGG